jgi:hypothetical protein
MEQIRKKRVLMSADMKRALIKLYDELHLIVVYLTSLCVIWAFFGMSGPV